MPEIKKIGEQEQEREEEMKIYQDLIAYFRAYNFELAPAESFRIRAVIIKEVLKENKEIESTTMKMVPWFEVMVRFLRYYYGIDYQDYMDKALANANKIENSRERNLEKDKIIKSLFKLIKKKYRPQQEMTDRLLELGQDQEEGKEVKS